MIEAVPATVALGEVCRQFVEQLVNEQIVRHGVAKEDWRVDVGVIERAGVRLVIQQRLTRDAEHLQRKPVPVGNVVSAPRRAASLEKRMSAS